MQAGISVPFSQGMQELSIDYIQNSPDTPGWVSFSFASAHAGFVRADISTDQLAAWVYQLHQQQIQGSRSR